MPHRTREARVMRLVVLYVVSACYILETFSQKGKTKTKLNQFTKNEPAVIMIIKNNTKKRGISVNSNNKEPFDKRTVFLA